MTSASVGRPNKSRGTRSVPKSSLPEPVTAHDVQLLRAQIMRSVRNLTPVAQQVIEGKVTWSNQQVAVYKALLNKVVPDISAHYEEKHVTNHNVHEMSRDQLMEIAANSSSLLKGAEDAEISEAYDPTEAESCRSEDTRDAPREAGGEG